MNVGTRRTLIGAMACCAIGAWSWTMAHGQESDVASDTVVMQSSVTGGRAVLRGTVLEYTGRELTIETEKTAPIRTYPAEDIVRVDTPLNASHLRGQELLAEGKLDDARLNLENALAEEERTWVQRDILASLVRCALARGDYVAAGSRFALLVKSDRDTRQFGLIPLAWSTDPPSPDLANKARFWIGQSDPVEKLLGASALLTDPKESQSAATALRRLMADTDVRVRRLAQAQLWRTRPVADDLAESEIVRWQTLCDELPESLRGGPLYLIGCGYAKLEQHEEAAMSLAWLPLVYRDDVMLAARAALRAGDEFSAAGQILAAAALYRQVIDEFATTPQVRDAKERLEDLAAPPTPGQ